MSIWNMKDYLSHLDPNSTDFSVQLKILKDQEKKISQEEKNLALRKKYIKWKIKYWQLIKSQDEELFKKVKDELKILSEKLRFWDKN